MEKPLFQISAEGWKSTDKLTFYADRIEHTWKMPPTANGKSVYLRDALSPYLSSQQTFGWGASTAFRSFGLYLGIGLILQQGFGGPVLQASGILFYLVALALLIYGLTRLKRQEWIYIRRRDGGTLVTLRAHAIEGWTQEEFRDKFKAYVQGSDDYTTQTI
jgi:hypothetical protein